MFIWDKRFTKIDLEKESILARNIYLRGIKREREKGEMENKGFF